MMFYTVFTNQKASWNQFSRNKIVFDGIPKVNYFDHPNSTFFLKNCRIFWILQKFCRIFLSEVLQILKILSFRSGQNRMESAQKTITFCNPKKKGGLYFPQPGTNLFFLQNFCNEIYFDLFECYRVTKMIKTLFLSTFPTGLIIFSRCKI